MKYDFTSIMDRVGKDAIAVEALGQMKMAPKPPKDGFDIIPMWVADMNFPTVPTIPEAIIERAKHPAYGYFSPRKEYYDAIIQWQKKRNGITDLTPECIGYENGVLGGVISALNVYCSRGDNVLVHKPTYIGFTNSLTNNGYHIVHSELVKDENDVWISRTWRRKSWSIISMQPFSVHRTTHADVYGSAGKSKRRWRSLRSTTSWS